MASLRNITGNSLLPASDYAEMRVQSYTFFTDSTILSPVFLCGKRFFSNFAANNPIICNHFSSFTTMNRKTVPVLLFALAAGVMVSCRQSWHVSEVSRSRLLVDASLDSLVPESARQLLAQYTPAVDSITKPVVGYSARRMDADRPESALSNLIADILVDAGQDYGEKPDFGICNMGGIRASLPEGEVTFGDVLEVAPFQNKIVFVTLSGADVLALFNQIASVGGEGVSKEVRLVMTPQRQLLDARISGVNVDPQKDYRIATIDYVAQGNDRMEAFKQKKDERCPQGERTDMRFVISDYFTSKMKVGEKVDARIEGRIVMK